MGHITHHAIIVTDTDYDTSIERAHAKAVELGCLVTSISGIGVNGYRSFLIAPDGSKSGWGASDEGDDRRAAWIKWAETTRYEDGSGPLEWVEVRYGADDGEAVVERHPWSDVHAGSTD